MGLHDKDVYLLELMRSYLGGNNKFYKSGESMIQIRITSLEVLTNVVIPHFNKYPLLTQKRADFEIFKQAVEILNRKEHLTIEGIRKLVSLRASLNNGLSDEVKLASPPPAFARSLAAAKRVFFQKNMHSSLK